jgi:hypothetical protein
MLENASRQNIDSRSAEPGLRQKFRILCVLCGVKIRDKASEDSYGLCLKCFYADLASRLSGQKRAVPGEFVSER